MEEMLRRAGHEILRVVRADEDEAYIASGDKSIPVLISPDGAVRRKVAEKYIVAGFSFVAIVAKTADVSECATIGDGSVVAEHAVVTAETKIGRFVKINTAATVTHECVIGDYATIAPRAVLLGRVRVCENAYVGAGAVVTKNVPDGETWVGVPAKKLKHGIH